MKTATQPASVGGIEFDALLAEERQYEAEVPEYAVEDGFAVGDTIIRKPMQLNMVLAVSNMPVTWRSRFQNEQDRVDSVCKKLEDLYYKGVPVTVKTSNNTYNDMAIASLTLTKNEAGHYYREIPITFTQIVYTTAKATTIPSSYLRSGTTSASAGTANTSSGRSGGSSGNSGSSGTSSGTSSSSNSGGSGGSILYNLGTNLGLIGGKASGNTSSGGGKGGGKNSSKFTTK